jgi:hypothetical protein
MNRLFAYCPKCDAEVLIAQPEWSQVPKELNVRGTCTVCEEEFDVNYENARLFVPNNTGTLG